MANTNRPSCHARRAKRPIAQRVSGAICQRIQSSHCRSLPACLTARPPGHRHAPPSLRHTLVAFCSPSLSVSMVFSASYVLVLSLAFLSVIIVHRHPLPPGGISAVACAIDSSTSCLPQHLTSPQRTPWHYFNRAVAITDLTLRSVSVAPTARSLQHARTHVRARI